MPPRNEVSSPKQERLLLQLHDGLVMRRHETGCAAIKVGEKWELIKDETFQSFLNKGWVQQRYVLTELGQAMAESVAKKPRKFSRY